MQIRSTLIKYLADLRLAISLLISIAVVSSLGTIIEQDQSIDFYKLNYPIQGENFNIINWKLITILGLNQAYTTWWFLSLLFIFGCSLMACSFLKQFPALDVARRSSFYTNKTKFQKLNYKAQFSNSSIGSIFETLSEKNYTIFQQKDTLYGYKGIIGRFSPIIVHVSMILILIGASVGATGGFNAQELVPKTEIFHIQNILSSNIFSNIPQISGRVNDFWVTYNKQNSIDQFYSDLSILNDRGQEIKRETISVNHPFQYKGITWYQTDWNISTLRMSIDDKIYQLPLKSLPNKKLWFTSFSFQPDSLEKFSVILDKLDGSLFIYNSSGELISNIDFGESVYLDKKVSFLDSISKTGLQIKADPGIPIIYTGFAFLMASTLLSYISYSQIWVLAKDKSILIGGTTNRAKLNFEIEFLNIKKLVKKRSL
jgi:cytochrome c biogenesis protein